MKKTFLSLLALSLAVSLSARAGLITAVPGPDDQGGMIMPMVSIQATAGMASDPTAGMINVSFSPVSTPLLSTLEQWSSGDWLEETAAWKTSLGSPEGVGGTPAANAGDGGLFNNQYGFMFMSMGTMMMANVPTGKSLAIKLTTLSSLNLESYNYGNAANRWDEVWTAGVNSQVLWNGSMWHNYYVLPAGSAAGTYTASYEIFIANTPFTGSTGFAQYDAAADAAVPDANFTATTVTYTWTVVPEPSTVGLILLATLPLLGAARRRFFKRA
jgi:hypothetical protein